MSWTPKITGAEPIIKFELSNEYRATLMGDIEAPGLIQYHYLLVILGRDDQPCLILGSEWSSLGPSYRSGYAAKDIPLSRRFAPLSREMSEKHGIGHSLPLFSERHGGVAAICQPGSSIHLRISLREREGICSQIEGLSPIPMARFPLIRVGSQVSMRA